MNPMEIVSSRANPLIDPHLDVWSWPIPVYLFLGGLVAGLMIIGAFQERFQPEKWESRLSLWSSAAALIMLSVGMFALWLDLENRFHAYRFYLAFRPKSPMSWGAWILVLAYPALMLWFLGSVSEDRFAEWIKKHPRFTSIGHIRKWGLTHRQTVLVFMMAVGAGLGIYTGILLHTLMARPLWNTGLLGPLFLASGVSTAAAFLMFSSKRDVVGKALLRWDIMAILIELTLLLLFVLDRATGSEVEKSAIRMILAGPYTGSFFGLVILGGTLIPLSIELAELKEKIKKSIVAPLMVLVGGFALRCILVAAGQWSHYNF